MKKGYINLIIYALIAFVIIGVAFNSGTFKNLSEITYDEFINKVENGQVNKVDISESELIITTTDNETFYTGNLENGNLVSFLNDEGVSFNKIEENAPVIISLFVSLLPMIILIGFMAFSLKLLVKSQGGGQNGIMSVGKNKSKLYLDKDTGVTFDDVAGQDEAKESLTEIIDYLHNKEKYVKIGAKLPKGVLLVGPPGTGKTLLAKAVAGEAKVPFFSLSGSDFVEMFVGVGASRVRDLFEDAKKQAPCIVFIDEIDSIGKSRDSGHGNGGHDEREQTLNQLLAEMDGFETDAGIIILAATNRPEILDKALLRPGRFDRRVIVDRPDLKGRIATLNVHSKDVLMDETVDMKEIALATSGAAGADLANMINEAALGAVRRGSNIVAQKDIMEAVEVVFAGKAKKDRVMTLSERRLVAYHEVGHAVVSALQKNSTPVQKITIIPRTMGALGYTMQVPEEEKYLMTREDICIETRTLLGGRCAEEVFFNVVSTGASNDIEKATAQIRNAITIYGMSDVFDMVALENRNNTYLDGSTSRTCSENTYNIVDKEISRIVKKLHNESREMLVKYSDMVNEIANYLIEKETIEGTEFMEIFRKYVKEGDFYELDNDTVFESNIDILMPSQITVDKTPSQAHYNAERKNVKKDKPLAVIVEPKKEEKPVTSKVEEIKTSPLEATKKAPEVSQKVTETPKKEAEVTPKETPKAKLTKNETAPIEKENALSALLKDVKPEKKEEKAPTPAKKETHPEPKKETKAISPFEKANQQKKEEPPKADKQEATKPEIKIEVQKKELPFEQAKKAETIKKEVVKVQPNEPKPLASNNNKKKKKNNNNSNRENTQGGPSDINKLMNELNSGNIKNDKKKSPFEKANEQNQKANPDTKADESSDDDISEDMY